MYDCTVCTSVLVLLGPNYTLNGLNNSNIQDESETDVEEGAVTVFVVLLSFCKMLSFALPFVKLEIFFYLSTF